MTKKILAALLALAMILSVGALSVSASAASAAPEKNPINLFTPMTSMNAQGSYDEETHVLTFTNQWGMLGYDTLNVTGYDSYGVLFGEGGSGCNLQLCVEYDDGTSNMIGVTKGDTGAVLSIDPEKTIVKIFFQTKDENTSTTTIARSILHKEDGNDIFTAFTNTSTSTAGAVTSIGQGGWANVVGGDKIADFMEALALPGAKFSVLVPEADIDHVSQYSFWCQLVIQNQSYSNATSFTRWENLSADTTVNGTTVSIPAATLLAALEKDNASQLCWNPNYDVSDVTTHVKEGDTFTLITTVTAIPECEHETLEYKSNADGKTHTIVRCLDCGEAIGTTEDCSGKGTAVDNEDGTHTVSAVCTLCEQELPSTTGKHTYEKGVCTFCGAKCPHEKTTAVSNEDGKTHDLVCDTCGEVTKAGVECEPANDAKPEIKDNGDGTHSVTFYCAECGQVHDLSTLPAEKHDWSEKDGVCTVCGAKCAHEDTTEGKAVHVEDTETHTITTTCDTCGAVVKTTTSDCSYGSDEKCTVCGAEMPEEKKACKHEGYETTYADAKDGKTHNVVCSNCKKVIDSEEHTLKVTKTAKDGVHTITTVCTKCDYEKVETAKCTYKDGVCTVCGIKCEHAKTESKTVKDEKNDDQHITTETCTVCGEVVKTTTAKCVYDEKTHACKDCGRGCEHKNAKAVYTPAADGKHTVTTTCPDCKYEKVETEACTYGADEICTKCGAKAACKHPEDKLEYTPNGDGTHTVVCTKCGETIDKAEKCPFVNGQKTCPDCGGYRPEEEGKTFAYPIRITKQYHGHLVKGRMLTVPHQFVDGKCIICGETQPEAYKVNKTETTETKAPAKPKLNYTPAEDALYVMETTAGQNFEDLTIAGGLKLVTSDGRTRLATSWVGSGTVYNALIDAMNKNADATIKITYTGTITAFGIESENGGIVDMENIVVEEGDDFTIITLPVADFLAAGKDCIADSSWRNVYVVAEDGAVLYGFEIVA